jgi:hypothetical protein
MDVEFLKENCKEKEYVIFVDSADQRLYQKADEYRYLVRDHWGNTVVDACNQTITGIDTMASRINFVYDYVLVFQEPYENVVSVELTEAYIPTAPVRDINRQQTRQEDMIRYLTISCPEIEQHMKRNKKASDYSIGMAKICWDSLEDKNFLFYKSPFTKRHFHPIGRLGKLNLRFFKNNTESPVDFKGAHHTLLLTITVLEPEQKDAPEYILNPQYDPHRAPDHFSSMHHADSEEDL